MKFVQKNSLELGDTPLPDLFILNYMPQLENIDVKIYLYILFLAKNGTEADKSDLAKKLNISEQDVSFGFERCLLFIASVTADFMSEVSSSTFR